MKYVRMTIEEACKIFKGNKNQTVLVAVQDLEKENGVIPFSRKTGRECINIIEASRTVTRVSDDFMNQLRVFSEYQKDVRNIEPHGMQSTILFRAVE